MTNTNENCQQLLFEKETRGEEIKRKTKTLLEVIDQKGFKFCQYHKSEENGEVKELAYFKYPSSCGGCVDSQRVMNAIFSKGMGYWGTPSAPYVHHLGDRQFEVNITEARKLVNLVTE